MGDYRITCRVIDRNGVILQVCIAGERYSITRVYDMIESGEHCFYTFAKGIRANVGKGISSTGRKFITTNQDGISENNLDELMDC